MNSSNKKEIPYLIVISLLIGCVVGSLDALFGIVLLDVSDFRLNHFNWLIFLLAPAGMVFMYFFQKYGRNSSKGMSLVFQVGHGEAKKIPKRLIPFVMIGTWLTHLFGGSAGREGVAVQLGATVANWFSRHQKSGRYTKLFLITGMAAGFAGLFQTPIAALFFAMEVLVVGRLKYEALLTALIAAFTASFVSNAWGLEKFSVVLQSNTTFDLAMIIRLIPLGIAFGLVGLLFTFLLARSKKMLAVKIPNPVLRIGLVGAVTSILLVVCFYGRYAGLGTNLIQASFSGESIYSYDWALKILLTVLTLSAGFQGGEVTPLFSIGASLGILLGGFLGLPIELAAALGYASVFGSATNTLLAPIFIGGEVFGFEYTPYFVVVCGIAYLCNMNQSIYSLQQNPILEEIQNTQEKSVK